MAVSFDDKFSTCIKNFNNISKPDYTQTELNYYADFIELTTLFSNKDGITLGDIQDKFFGEKDYENAEKRDEDEIFLREIFQIISERFLLYNKDYPFSYSEDEILTLKSDLTVNNKLYISLLLSSKLNIFNEFRTDLTTDFESVSYAVLKNFLPVNSTVKEFGKNTEYKGNAIEKIKSLADDLDLAIDDYELNQVGERNNQERGLDIIGWLPFNDKCGNKIVFLCQCACGKQYESKQHDTRRFENYLRFYKTNPQHIMFIPYSLINVRAKKFYHSDYIEKDYLIFERKRILEYHRNTPFEATESCKLVNKCIEYSS
ncbi:hypothetical protein [Flavobacterium lindanitolerans]|uniref:hypothetical protein n=1 Tax=Flavobacterium lindanitolerans TaxID=428988 RepID=UPI0031CE204A